MRQTEKTSVQRADKRSKSYIKQKFSIIPTKKKTLSKIHTKRKLKYKTIKTLVNVFVCVCVWFVYVCVRWEGMRKKNKWMRKWIVCIIWVRLCMGEEWKKRRRRSSHSSKINQWSKTKRKKQSKKKIQQTSRDKPSPWTLVGLQSLQFS